ncbi:hypothetical protein [Arthrobacter sp. fls2-241-R2A-172]|uniref:hypothetical protein n=1 Tax=Arthrobacter sp. fls2-241-R2A-172 TaxID=3040325 RepID=UPI00254EE3D9|nr:hypothetical protein [Arthrobacter sp. fls2-241-R2A-172]
MGKYFEHDVLRGFYLEDSWVLDINASRGQLVITAEFVLTEEHPSYASARPGEQYCYRKGVLVFDGVTDLTWTGQLSSRPSRDPDGSVDYGNIDSLIIEGTTTPLKEASAQSNSTLHPSAWHWSRTARSSLRPAPLLTSSPRPVKDPSPDVESIPGRFTAAGVVSPAFGHKH